MTPEYIRLMDLNHHVDACLMANLTEKVYDHKTFSEIETSVAHFQAAGVLHVQHGRLLDDIHNMPPLELTPEDIAIKERLK